MLNILLAIYLTCFEVNECHKIIDTLEGKNKVRVLSNGETIFLGTLGNIIWPLTLPLTTGKSVQNHYASKE